MADPAQRYFRKRATTSEMLRRVGGCEPANLRAAVRHPRAPPSTPTGGCVDAPKLSTVRRPTAGVRPTLVLYGNARFAVASPGSMASPVRAYRFAVERHPLYSTRPIGERDTSKVDTRKHMRPRPAAQIELTCSPWTLGRRTPRAVLPPVPR